MSKIENNCGKCNKFIPSRIRIINCESYKKFFHVKCCDLNHKTFDSFIQTNEQWYCTNCTNCNLISTDSNVLHNVNLSEHSIVKPVHTHVNTQLSTRNTKCGKCEKNMPDYLKIVNCGTCKNFFHIKCSGTSKRVFLRKQELGEPWVCQQC